MRAAVIALAVALAACSGGSDRSSSSPTTTAAPLRLTLTVTGAEVASAAVPPPAFPADVQEAVRATLDAYVQRATVSPLTTGTAPDTLAEVFTTATRPRLATGDRAALTDEGLPRTRLEAGRAEATLTALAGPDGAVGVVVARITVEVTGDDGLTLARTGDLTLVAEGPAWLVDAYEVSVTRQVPGAAPTTTTAAAP